MIDTAQVNLQKGREEVMGKGKRSFLIGGERTNKACSNVLLAAEKGENRPSSITW